MTLTDRIRRGGKAVLGAFAGLSLLAILFLSFEIVDELRFLSSANSDNVHWTLSQAEVEFLEFQNAVDRARMADDPAPNLDEVIIEFDVFYSRLATLGTGLLYSPLREWSQFRTPLLDARERLENMIPLIDGPRNELAAALPDIAAELTQIRPLIRKMATTGLEFFAFESDASRTSVAVTLSRVALLTVGLLMALAALLYHARRVTRKSQDRERALAASNARLHTILGTSLDGIIVTDLHGKVIDFSPSAEKIFQRSAEDVKGKRLSDIIVPEYRRAEHEENLRSLRETGTHELLRRGRIKLDSVRADGEIFPTEHSIAKASAGDEDLLVVFLRDISHRVAAENELVQARDRALAGEKAKAEFLAMMTHEIRTPLNGVLGNLSLLEDTKLSLPQSRYVRNMKISGELLMRHVNDVLDIARFESGADTAQEQAVHIGHMIQDIVDSQVSNAQSRGNVLQWGWTGEPAGWLRLDASRLQQVLLNLLGNAIKFTRDGRVTIEAELQREGGGLVLELRVIDTGAGIPEADQKRIFEDFQTVERAVGESIGGTGLGLGIVRRFVRAMKGEIGVESDPGEGSVFWLRLPVTAADDMRPALASEIEPEAAADCELDILLAEDNDINLELAREVLERMGHCVTTARNGQQAVDAAAKRHFDLILMDIRMPMLDGLAATREIRTGDGPCRETPIVAFSANVLPEARDRFAAAGMSDFLGKPLQTSELRQVIARLSNKHRAMAPAAEPVAAPAPAPEPVAVQATPAPAPTPAPQAAPEHDRDSVIARLGRRHLEETEELFDWLAASPEDLGAVADRAHKIAGSAAAFGQQRLRDALVALEKAAETGDPDAVAPAISRARAEWETAPAPCVG
ncbi:ATP-binding protein [uncultured Salipiger sp.]|uniref:ATP-binding protein n=1 Tax=uncultured Salipiger sp. TaxID=499810 RepID=UPI00259A874B|nr:ATP-binding protein [uncultured Salipiger sp.]